MHIHTNIYTYIYIYIHICIYAYIHIYTHIYIYIYIRTYIHIHICMHTYIHIHIYVCMYIYVYVYIYFFMYIYIYIYILVDIIIIIMLCRQHGYPWPSLATSPNHSSPPAGPQGYILCPHIVAVCKFELVVLLLHGHMWGSIGVYIFKHIYIYTNKYIIIIIMAWY